MVAYITKVPVCVACGEWGLGPLCLACRRRLRPGRAGVVSGVAVNYALHHSGIGRVLVHRLKYHGLAGAADVLAAVMAPLVPSGVTAIVPVPRAAVRRVVYGIDPAWELARRIGARTGVPVARALAAPVWWPRHAGGSPQRRSAPRFRLRRPLLGPVALIDDVVTSGATVRGALAALGAVDVTVVTATSPGMMVISKASTASGRLRDSTAAWH